LQERKSFQNNTSSLAERAKRAEIALLEHKLETGVAILERAHKDAGQRVKDLETELAKLRSGSSLSEDLKGAIAEWKAKREEVATLITASKNEFFAQIEQIKAGKTLSQLPKISVPKPPPAPKLKGQFVTQNSPVAPEKSVATVLAMPNAGVIGNRSQPANVLGGFFLPFFIFLKICFTVLFFHQL
uniref:MT domain-containing protein n=1 Tax=Gongylonema pulchrum TaxID=637853 RepID=A0A183DN33_9BILA